MRTEDHRYRTVAELLYALRDEHQLSQTELAQRCGLSRTQLCRYESGIAEPSLRTLRRMLATAGWAPTFGLEPTGAALDERLDAGGQLWAGLGFDTWLAASRVIWPALDAGVPLVVGGELAAGLQGIPINDPELVLHLRLPALAALHTVVNAAHCVLGRAELPGLDGVADPATSEDELVIVAGTSMLRVVISDAVPATIMVTVPRTLDQQDGTGIAVPVIELGALRTGGTLGSTAEALADRLAARGERAPDRSPSE
ncbi:MAG: helix-turn-helix domain-containing protein [Pseudonocardiaceae bacterium]|nr:helix-turn-helix domain-containing protein [Pseudonocardiaceae bacterium]